MKNKLLNALAVLLSGSAAIAQCASTATAYDLTVSGSVTVPPGGPSYTMAIVCNGGHLLDSANCCTRFIHVEPGGFYEVGPSAYGVVYLKSGATFDAHNTTSSYNVFYEAGATILNYSGPSVLCTAVSFPSGSCTSTGIAQDGDREKISVFPNPCTTALNFSNVPRGSGILVLDLTGRVMMSATPENGQLDVSSLSPGIYYWRVEGSSAAARGKFTVLR